ncbi:MAG TPA: hypothetical protein VKA64_09125 [Gammaproteobacteria bacterium]|nr:hypothetical protein [Gammaproteobacteria bacterium]
MRPLPFVLALLVAAPTGAETVYRVERPDGTVAYTGEPRPGAEAVTLPEAQYFDPRPEAEPAPPARPGLAITRPRQGDAFRAPAGRVEVALHVRGPGGTVVLRLDGREVGRGRPPFSLHGVAAGRHVLHAELQRDGETVAAAGPVAFRLVRTPAPKAPLPTGD